MQVTYTAYYTDGTSGTVTCEKPPGAHPDSFKALQAGIVEAERLGKTVAKLGRSRLAFGVILDGDLPTREQIMDGMARYASK
jgi:hypothetical protein